MASQGILRDSEGIPLLWFWAKVATTTSDETEVEAIVKGIELCKQYGHNNFEIETDSVYAIRAFQGKVYEPNLVYKTRKYKNYRHRILHVLRQQNLAADILAKNGRNQQDLVSVNYHTLPKQIKLQIFLDRVGLGNFRKRNNKNIKDFYEM
ncbi:hypothetical protein CASFOL_002072 [Castilleja foliolosa]|uniref:RNase H type-1 domain-containing protein n=1 Tax=Castilleja foliolosa TaxID=1961234 RepID=A0ABD3EGS0_9LAMI